MTTISDLFNLKVARSAPFDDHESGDVAFITNGYRDNGLLGYITPLPEDRIFEALGVCVSAFCETTVPKPPFIARGNGGSGLTILVPKQRIAPADLWGYASYVSNRHGWKFSFGRMATKSRLEVLEIPDEPPQIPSVDAGTLLPRSTRPRHSKGSALRFATVVIRDLFDVQSGDFHSVEELPEGSVPLVSCGAQDNGIIGFYAPPPEKIYRNMLMGRYRGSAPCRAP